MHQNYLYTQKQNFSWIRQKMTHCKNLTFVMMLAKLAIFTMGVYGGNSMSYV